ncbi:UNVERIFIED_ORG: hypothetical protein M2438_000824 [Methylobacterium sp. SuP10 SLI 274]|uniref:hypothetical protein n=1 Tax=Methylorubrum extorquens TaxID=408 RepID=UPI0020A1EDCB|nr:hypothetical protein [Methylorubrum extorquens]MCP1561821.1 hypothetical protein [Methylorubrum extorquens]MDF9790328.1 hypothetical protein [Methylorubrum extorquens]MDH6635649.1 hypothetical protein [Methylobacterium sp. SuP10 SLI 274]
MAADPVRCLAAVQHAVPPRQSLTAIPQASLPASSAGGRPRELRLSLLSVFFRTKILKTAPRGALRAAKPPERL